MKRHASHVFQMCFTCFSLNFNMHSSCGFSNLDVKEHTIKCNTYLHNDNEYISVISIFSFLKCIYFIFLKKEVQNVRMTGMLSLDETNVLK